MSYYEDELAKWYVSPNNKHSSFLNQIKDEKLKEQTETVIDTKKFDSSFDTRFNFDVKGKSEQFSVWVDEDPTRNKLYRLTPGENSSKPPTSNTGGGGGSGFKPNTGERGFFDSKSKQLVTWEEWEELKNDFAWRLLTPKEVNPTNYLIQKNGKEILKVWIGKWIKPAS